MINNLKYLLTLVAVCLLIGYATAQGSGTKPIFMVVPFAKTSSSFIEAYEDDNTHQRTITAIIQEALKERGAEVIDFFANYKDLEARGIFRDAADTDLKTTLLDNSPADIFIEVEVTKEAVETIVILKAYDAFTQLLLSTKSSMSKLVISRNGARSVIISALSGGNSGGGNPTVNDRRNSPPPAGGTGGLGSGTGVANGENLVVLTDFLNLCNESFGNLIKEGRPVTLELKYEPDCQFDFSYYFTHAGKEDELSIFIENWLSEKTNAISYGDARSLNNTLTFTSVKIPVVKESKGELRRYTPTLFSNEVVKYCRQLKLVDDPDLKIQATRSVRGGYILIIFK